MELKPKIVTEFFDPHVFDDLKNHVTQIRRIFENTPFHDKDAADDDRFNRWYWHNLPLLRELHCKPAIINIASEIFGELVKPSYVFLSMYGKDGICPLHTDRPQCKYTIDYCISQKEPWEIFVNDKPYLLNENDALCYSGTDQPHYRNTIQDGNFCNLAFFHFVPINFVEKLD